MRFLNALRPRWKLLLVLAGCVTLLNVAVCVWQPWRAPTQAAAVVEPVPLATTPEVPARLAVDSRSAEEERDAGPFRTVADSGKKAAAVDMQEAFDKTQAGALPAGWMTWTNTGPASFGVSAAKALSGEGSLASSGGSGTAACAWPDLAPVADVQASAAVYVGSLIPAQVFVRGSGTAAPTWYAVSVTRGLEVQLLRVVKGTPTTLGTVKSSGYLTEKWVRVTLRAEGKDLRVRVVRPDTGEYLTGEGKWDRAPAWVLTASDGEITGPGLVGVARPARFAGTVHFDDFAATGPTADEAPAAAAAAPPKAAGDKAAAPPKAAGDKAAAATAWERPTLPRHYPHIRVALLAYAGNPMGPLEDRLLRESVDLVVPHAPLLKHVHDVAPDTPQLIYTNTSNLYGSLLTDWLAYADRNALPREAAFYHASSARKFSGESPASQPVTWFWAVHRSGKDPTNLTSAAHSKAGKVPFAGAGDSVALGFPDRFREINLALASGAGGGWSAVLEYVSAVDDAGAPARWSRLTTLADTTAGLSRSGQVTFDPPADWKPATVGGSARLFLVRFRTNADGAPPVASGILGRDYVAANGTTAGTIPAFDAAADADGDGYLNDAEYAKRAAGKDARFLHESRMFAENYGQMRFATNPSPQGYRDWAVDHCRRALAAQPLAGGLFMDNSGGVTPVRAGDVLESVTDYAADYGALLHAVADALKPKLVLANTAGGNARAEPVVRQCPAYLEEFLIRPLAHHYGQFEECADLVTRRAALTSPPPYAVLDSHAQRGAMTDPRTQLATLAYYYLIADPDATFLMFYGGQEPAGPWERHWTAAVAYDVGKPAGRWSQLATGKDPANAALTYRVYQRRYGNALVLYKPLSYGRGVKEPASLGDETATKHDLDGTYRPLRADGSLGEATTSVSLRNGEGAILIRP